jgi:hypothetical protein
MKDSLDDLFHARVAEAEEPSDLMRERVFAAIAGDRRRARISSTILRYAAAFVIVIGGGGLAFWLVRPQHPAPAASIAFVENVGTAPAIEREATVVLIVASVPDADATMRRWPQTNVRVTGVNARRIEVPSARYRATLAKLAQLGTLSTTTEHVVNLGAALARATDETTRAALRARLAYAHIDVDLRTRSGT